MGRRVYEALVDHVPTMVAAVLMAGGATILFVGLVLRDLFSYSIPWSIELATYLIIWSVFLSFGAAVLRNEHVASDMLLGRLPRPAIAALTVFKRLLAFALGAFYGYYGLLVVLQQHRLGMHTSSSLNAPLWLLHLAVPIGFGLLLLGVLGWREKGRERG